MNRYRYGLEIRTSLDREIREEISKLVEEGNIGRLHGIIERGKITGEAEIERFAVSKLTGYSEHLLYNEFEDKVTNIFEQMNKVLGAENEIGAVNDNFERWLGYLYEGKYTIKISVDISFIFETENGKIDNSIEMIGKSILDRGKGRSLTVEEYKEVLKNWNDSYYANVEVTVYKEGSSLTDYDNTLIYITNAVFIDAKSSMNDATIKEMLTVAIDGSKQMIVDRNVIGAIKMIGKIDKRTVKSTLHGNKDALLDSDVADAIVEELDIIKKGLE